MNSLGSYCRKVLVLILALQILNLSVYGGEIDADSIAAPPNTIGEVNQIDFLIEYISEIILDHKNAFPEDGAHNNHSNLTHLLKHIPLKLTSNGKDKEPPYSIIGSPSPIPFQKVYKYLFLKQINPPPPKLNQL